MTLTGSRLPGVRATPTGTGTSSSNLPTTTITTQINFWFVM